MKIRSQWFVALTLLSIFSPDFAASGAGSKPSISLKCGEIVGGSDENGTYAFFNPAVSISYHGLPLKVTAYYSQNPNTPLSKSGQKISIIEGKSKSDNYYRSDFDFSYKFLEYGQKQTGYYKMYLVAIDNLKRKSTASCIFKDYYFSKPSSIQNPSPSKFSPAKGFNKNNCSFNGQKLFGKVFFTNYPFEADFKIYETNYSFESDLKVYLTDYSFEASDCGQWYPTKYAFEADFKVYVVKYSLEADFKTYLTRYRFESGT